MPWLSLSGPCGLARHRAGLNVYELLGGCKCAYATQRPHRVQMRARRGGYRAAWWREHTFPCSRLGLAPNLRRTCAEPAPRKGPEPAPRKGPKPAPARFLSDSASSEERAPLGNGPARPIAKLPCIERLCEKYPAVSERDSSPSSERETSPQRSTPGPWVVGIGASAGGLTALQQFFSCVPPDSGLAFVVIVHLTPDRESHLSELLQACAAMPVLQVTETVALEPNTVYVIPPGRNLSTIDTHLRLSALQEARRERAPIDHFFRTLSETHEGHAIGVILSGTGSDGTLGIKEIKKRGGLVIVQDPNQAEFDGMPQSAIATGLVDLVLPLAAMPGEILGFLSTQPRVTIPHEDQDLEGEERRLLPKILAQVRARTGRDFSRYKRSTIMRRIQRRMQLRHVVEFGRYLELLREEVDEVRNLATDFLITVTHFFRDPEVFERLESEVIPELFRGKDGEESVRVWTAGCSTGEEAYSLAILLLEAAERHNGAKMIQVFASDLHERSLERARDGFYPGDIEADVSKERLQRFFVKESGGYRIRKEVRELVIFAPHNLLGDPPFSKLDLITCRNLLIYFQRDVQRDVIELFHYALRGEGFVVLGTSETVESSELFRTYNKQCCIFRKRNVLAPEQRLPVFPIARTIPNTRPRISLRADRAAGPVSYGAIHQRMVEQLGPPSMLLGADHKILHLSPHAGRFLGFPGGELTSSAFKLVREELRIELRSTLLAAGESKQPARSKPVPLRIDGQQQHVILEIRPAVEPHDDNLFLVIFEVRDASDDETRVPAELPAQLRDAVVRELDAELLFTKQRLQVIIEEYETTQEEMRASNEEMQSSNEELRSTLEELETSKEELQSMNEELHTVNQENRHKVEELAQLSSDLQNLLAATDIATLFLDRQLKILRFTPKVSELFNVRTTDRGRPISDITHRLGYPEILTDAERVLRDLLPMEREVQDDAGRWHLSRVLPYRSAEHRIDGVVITFIEITWRKASQDELRRARDFLAVATTAARLGWGTWEFGTGQAEWDSRARELLCLGKDATTIDAWLHRIHPDDRARVEASITDETPARTHFEFEFRVLAPDASVRHIRSAGVFERHPDGHPLRGTGLVWDVTEERRTQDALHRLNVSLAERLEERTQLVQESEDRLQTMLTAASACFWTADSNGEVSEDSPAWRAYTGQTFEQWRGLGWAKVVHPDDRDATLGAWSHAIRNEAPIRLEFRLYHAPTGTYRWIVMRGAPFRHPPDRLRGWSGMNLDIHDCKRET